MHLVGYLYEDYHDARSLEHKTVRSIQTLLQISAENAERNQKSFNT
jgi:hypothetical protein